MVRKHIFVFFMLFVSVLTLNDGAFSAAPTTAPTTTGPTCDENFYKVMANRAWMEGKRELEMAQTLILKADSVLEYSCFGDRLSENRAGTGFTTVNAITGHVNPAYQSYLAGNFNHAKAGGTYSGGGGSACGAMARIWDFLRCQNFNIDHFSMFKDLATNDSRTLPASCSDPTLRTNNWNSAVIASNTTPVGGTVSPSPVLGGVDETVLYLDKIDPTACANLDPIPTGLIVNRQIPGTTTPEYDDKVCSAPGCDYVPDSSDGKCVPTY